MTFACKSVFQALNIITILKILYHAYSTIISLLIYWGGGGLEGVFLIYTKSLYVRLILLKYATSGTAIISEIS